MTEGMLPQYIVKPSRSHLSGFAWHRDSAWCSGSDVDYHPYLSIWVALDDAHAGALVSACTLVKCGLLVLRELFVLSSQAPGGRVTGLASGTASANMHVRSLPGLSLGHAGNGALLVRPSSGAADVLVEVRAGAAVRPCCTHACNDDIGQKA